MTDSNKIKFYWIQIERVQMLVMILRLNRTFSFFMRM